MEKVVVGVSLNTLFKPKLENSQSSVSQTDDIFLLHKEDFWYDKGPLFDWIEQLLRHKKNNLLSFIEIILISDASPLVSSTLIQSLIYYDLEIDQIILSTRSELMNYLNVLNVDLYLSGDLELVRQAQKCGMMSGLVYLKSLMISGCRIGIDHRLFNNEEMLNRIGKMIPVFGFLQKRITNFKVSLLTTRSYSVDSWIKELFKLSECKINEVCFLGMGLVEDISPLFDFSVYIEGNKQDEVIKPNPSDYILNIDF